MDDKLEKLGRIIDGIDNLAHALQLPLPDNMHIECLRSSLPEKVEELKKVFIEISGNNPWG